MQLGGFQIKYLQQMKDDKHYHYRNSFICPVNIVSLINIFQTLAKLIVYSFKNVVAVGT